MATTDRPACSAAEANSSDKLSINDADAISPSQIDLLRTVDPRSEWRK